MTDIAYHQITHGSDPLDILKKLVLHKLHFSTESKLDVVELFKKNKFFTALKDFKNIHEKFIVIQRLNSDEKILLSNSVEFVRSNKLEDNKVELEPIIRTEYVNQDGSFNGLIEGSNKECLASIMREEIDTTVSAFFIKDLIAYQASRRLVNSKLFVKENTFIMKSYSSRNYEVDL